MLLRVYIAVSSKLRFDSQNFINAKVNQSGIERKRAHLNSHTLPDSNKLKVLNVAWEHKSNPKNHYF